MNEAVALNTETTKEFFEERGIIALRADKSGPAPDVDRLLEQLGHKSRSIPFYAIFPASNPNKPILFDGLITSPKQFIDKFEDAAESPIGGEPLAKSETN